jgi:hypothetical protein
VYESPDLSRTFRDLGEGDTDLRPVSTPDLCCMSMTARRVVEILRNSPGDNLAEWISSLERRRMGPSGTLLDFLGRVPGTLGALTWATRYARTRGGRNYVFMRRRMVYVQVSRYSDGLGSAFCKTADA